MRTKLIGAVALVAILVVIAVAASFSGSTPAPVGDSSAETVAIAAGVDEDERPVEAALGAPPQVNDGTKEGIKVHGHWTIEVRDPDGTLLMERAFENALNPLGGRYLADFLASDRAVGSWRVSVYHPTAKVCEPDLFCYVVEPGDTLAGPNIFDNLTVDVPAGGDDKDKLVLSGHLTALADGTVRDVGTSFTFCASSVAPSQCAGGTGVLFTTTTLVPTIAVVTGQQVLVRVVISFS